MDYPVVQSDGTHGYLDGTKPGGAEEAEGGGLLFNTQQIPIL